MYSFSVNAKDYGLMGYKGGKGNPITGPGGPIG
jgi:hypothetical protein